MGSGSVPAADRLFVIAHQEPVLDRALQPVILFLLTGVAAAAHHLVRGEHGVILTGLLLLLVRMVALN